MEGNKRGQSGLVTGLVFGIAGLVIAIIIAFVITSTLVNANFFVGDRTTGTVTNETVLTVNTAGDIIAQYSAVRSSYTLTAVWNATDDGLGYYNVSVPAAGWPTLNANTGNLTNTTAALNLSVSYTYLEQTSQEQSTNTLSSNFTSGVNNVSGKIPTVLLIAAIVLILSILAILVAVWYKMRLGNSNL